MAIDTAKTTNTVPRAPIDRYMARLRAGYTLVEAFADYEDVSIIRRCLIAIGAIVPKAQRRQQPDDPTPQRFLQKDESMRKRVYDATPEGKRGKFSGVTAVWRVPPTLRLDRLGVEAATRHLRQAGDDGDSAAAEAHEKRRREALARAALRGLV